MIESVNVPDASSYANDESSPAGPLAGVRVIELAMWVAGPSAAGLLADWGADVIKVEPLSGDSARGSRAAIDKAGEFSAMFISVNRGKRSITVGRR